MSPPPDRPTDGAVNPPQRTPSPRRPKPCAHLEALLATELAAGNGVRYRHPSPSHKWGEVVRLTRPFRRVHAVVRPVTFQVRNEADGWEGAYRCAEHGSELLGPIS